MSSEQNSTHSFRAVFATTQACWRPDPERRPTFKTIVNALNCLRTEFDPQNALLPDAGGAEWMSRAIEGVSLRNLEVELRDKESAGQATVLGRRGSERGALAASYADVSETTARILAQMFEVAASTGIAATAAEAGKGKAPLSQPSIYALVDPLREINLAHFIQYVYAVLYPPRRECWSNSVLNPVSQRATFTGRWGRAVNSSPRSSWLPRFTLRGLPSELMSGSLPRATFLLWCFAHSSWHSVFFAS